MLLIHGHETEKVPLGVTPTVAQGNRCYRASMYNQVVVLTTSSVVAKIRTPRPPACEVKNNSSEPPVQHSVEFVNEIKTHGQKTKFP